MTSYVIAKYIRLSVDDALSDSMSIENQRLMLDRHINVMDMPNAEVLEFVDNGHSGMDFERPGVGALLELVRQGGVNCIIVKDFSRFGRDALETGFFIERLFPLFRVRFISVSEGFDSDDHIGDTGGLEVSFQFLKNEWCSRDLSKKICSAKRERIRRGEYYTKHCAFGFKLNAQRRYDIDEPAADMVRYIFNLFVDGKSIQDIQRRLYDDKRPTPSEYRRRVPEPLCVWSDSSVRGILYDEQYIGTYVAGKTASDISRRKVILKDKSEWTRIPGLLPVLVEKSVFDAAQVLLGAASRAHSKPRSSVEDSNGASSKSPASALRGKVVCGCCGRKLELTTARNAEFRCVFSRVAPDMPCHGFKISKSDLESRVFELISEKARELVSNMDSDAHAVSSSLLYNPDKKRRLYESFIGGDISADEYRSAISSLGESVWKPERLAARESDLRELAESVLRESELSPHIADSFIESVGVAPDGGTYIHWKPDLSGELNVFTNSR